MRGAREKMAAGDADGVALEAAGGAGHGLLPHGAQAGHDGLEARPAVHVAAPALFQEGRQFRGAVPVQGRPHVRQAHLNEPTND